MSEWINGTLADAIASLDAGVSVNAEDRPHGAGDIGVLKTSAISGGAFRAEQNKTVLQHERRLVAEPVEADSILVSRMNTPALVGESCYVREAHPTLFLPDRLWQLKPKDRAQLNMRWLSFVLQSADYRRYVEVHATGTSGSMKNLPKSKLLALPVQYPAAAEQSVIAQILDTLDTAIHETEALIVKLKAVKQGLLHDLLTRGIDADGQLRPPQSEAPQFYKESPLGWTPKEWGVQPLDAYTASEITYGIVQAGPHIPDGVPYIRTGDMSGDVLIRGSMLCTSRRIANSYARSEVRAGEIVMAIRATVGKVLSVPDDLDGANLTQGTARISPNTKTDGTFLLWAIRHSRAQKEIQLEVKGTTFAEITLGALRKVLIAAPIDISEQIEIAKRLAAIDERLWMEQEGLAKQLSEKSGLMDDLLTGRARVTPLLEST